ncbi:protease [Escherichia phage Sciku]|nr:ATP-dependent protease [Escherichia phage Shashou]QEG06935.1 protease [Escherichia phage Sciku]QEG07016.1 protease [Escherichia phage Snoke]
MTTIAFDGKTMACDTRVTGDHIYNTDTKIYENEFVVIGVAGNAEAGILLVKDDSILVPKHYDFDFSALVWVKDIETLCKVEFYKSWDCALSSVIPVADGFAAVGSGAPYALAAMYLGNTATRAITIAEQFDPNTGGNIITKQLLG